MLLHIIYDDLKILYFNFDSGESGSYLYVAAEGEYDVIKDGKVLGRWHHHDHHHHDH